MVFAVCIHVCDFGVDGFFEMVRALESPVCEALAFERLPASFDVVELWCVFWKPLRGEPVAALVECCAGGFAGVHGAVVENDADRFAPVSGLWAVEAVEPFDEPDHVAGAFAPGGLDDEFAGREVERADHRHLLRLARCFDPQVGTARGPRPGQIGMRECFGFIGKQQDDVAGQGLLFEQLEPYAGAFDSVAVLPASQRVAGPLAGKAPFLRKTTESLEREMRCPVRVSISAASRGSVQFVRFSTGKPKTSRATTSAASAFTGDGPGATRRAIPESPSRMKAERQPRTVSSRTRKASPISMLVHPDSESRMPRARSAASRSETPACSSRASSCSAVASNGDFPDMFQLPNQTPKE